MIYLNNLKICISIFAIFLSLFFLTGCFEKQENIKGKNSTTSSEKQTEKNEENNDETVSITNNENIKKMKDVMVIRPGGYGFALPIDFELDTSASTLIYKDKKDNIKVEFSENQFNKQITIEEFGGYAQSIHKNIAQNLEIDSVDSDKYTDYPYFLISAYSPKEQKKFLIYGFLGNNNETAYMSLWEFNANDMRAEGKIKNITRTFGKYQ